MNIKITLLACSENFISISSNFFLTICFSVSLFSSLPSTFCYSPSFSPSTLFVTLTPFISFCYSRASFMHVSITIFPSLPFLLPDSILLSRHPLCFSISLCYSLSFYLYVSLSPMFLSPLSRPLSFFL